VFYYKERRLKMSFEELAAEMQNEEKALELQSLVKELFNAYLNKVEESDEGREFHPVTISCCRSLMVEPLNKLLDKMRELSGADVAERKHDNP
jgi:3'-phosphoadenosine 5'-phosphosulfate sulfotransferase (PAPS reductase)/FAD synthetase